MSVAYARREYRSTLRDESISLSHFLRIRNTGMVSLLISHQRGRGAATSGFLGYSMSLGTRRAFETSAELQRQHDDDSHLLRVSAMQSLPVGEGVGWRLSAAHDGSYDAAWQQRMRAADIELQAARNHGVSGQNLLARGGATWLAGTARAARSVDGSFAVVDLDGLAGIPVLVENQFVTRTDGHGRAVLNNLLPYETNRISIDPLQLPLDTEIKAREIVIQPSWHSGLLVNFPVQRIHPGLMRLVLQDGTAVPTSAVVTFNGGRFVVAKDGLTYVTTLDHGTTGTAQWPGGRCVFRAGPPLAGDPLTDLGDVLCRNTQEPGTQ
jgi:outer membrane usher protein